MYELAGHIMFPLGKAGMIWMKGFQAGWSW